MFTPIKSMMNHDGVEGVTTDMVIEFCDKQIEALAKRSTAERKPTKTQIENESLKADILTALATADKPVTIEELMGLCDSIANLSNQRISRLLKGLCDDGLVERTHIKRKAHFALSSPTEGTEDASIEDTAE
jgi:predicted transcriptional regulator